MSTPHRSIHTLSKSLWENSRLKGRFDQKIWESAQDVDCVAPAEPLVEHGGVCPARIHADFNRMLKGRPPAFPETTFALASIRVQLDRLGFVAETRDRYVFSKDLNIAGEVDAHGMIDGHVPALVELKVVRWLPQIVRAADSAQLVMYDMARNGRVGRTLLVALYVQPSGSFRAVARMVFSPEKLEPLVLELAA